MDCAHLVKANSIQGCKMNNINVVYTPWSNLKKTADMDVGQIGFHRQKDVKIVTVEKKVNEILNRLEKTKMERFPDLAAEKESRDREERNEKKAQIQEMKRKEKEEMKKKREMDELRYAGTDTDIDLKGFFPADFNHGIALKNVYGMKEGQMSDHMQKFQTFYTGINF
ncbi:coiled-coil domain-containing protein 25 isoform X2 [Ochotona curzoniae]|nr:coiled-coil domain-containing protein 25 isoform X2 [Ochotona curzoniae]